MISDKNLSEIRQLTRGLGLALNEVLNTRKFAYRELSFDEKLHSFEIIRRGSVFTLDVKTNFGSGLFLAYDDDQHFLRLDAGMRADTLIQVLKKQVKSSQRPTLFFVPQLQSYWRRRGRDYFELAHSFRRAKGDDHWKLFLSQSFLHHAIGHVSAASHRCESIDRDLIKALALAEAAAGLLSSASGNSIKGADG